MNLANRGPIINCIISYNYILYSCFSVEGDPRKNTWNKENSRAL